MPTTDLIGSSPKFRAVLADVDRIAPVDSVVLIQGETGTGKEVIARAIHEASPRHNNRFIALNCAAIPGALLESELFGHERGAFTGAVTEMKGRFQMADRGTLFLDEIGDLPLELQPKLLRALQEQEFERLGSTARHNKTIDSIPDEVVEVLKAHDWPGNIRELQNFIERAVLFSPGSVLRLPLGLKQTVMQRAESAARTLADADREHILETLRQTNWLIGGEGGAANRLGLPRTTLIYKMRKLGIEMRRCQRPRPIRQLADGRCHAAANC